MSTDNLLNLLLVLCVILTITMWITRIYQVQELVEIAIKHNITLPEKYNDTIRYIKSNKGN